MWLSKQEADECRGWHEELGYQPCAQSRPCVFRSTNEECENFQCPTHGTFFKPAMPGEKTKLWPRILNGLKLFGIPKETVKLCTVFDLPPLSTRQCFDTELSELVCPRGKGKFLLSSYTNKIFSILL